MVSLLSFLLVEFLCLICWPKVQKGRSCLVIRISRPVGQPDGRMVSMDLSDQFITKSLPCPGSLLYHRHCAGARRCTPG